MSLFSAQPELSQQPYSILISAVAHGLVIGLVFLGIFTAPKVKAPTAILHYDVRQLELHTLDTEMERAEASAVKSLQHHAKTARPPAPVPNNAEQSPLMRQIALATPGRQTLIQPDVLKPITPKVEIPVPTVVLWNAANAPSKVVVAPQPVKPNVAIIKPSLRKPNQEVNLADISIPSSTLAKLNSPMRASTTTQLVVQGPKPTPPAPITTASGSGQPTSATIMSISDTKMANGHVALPPVNVGAAKESPGALAASQAKDSSQSGHGDPASKPAGAPASHGSSTDSAQANGEDSDGSRNGSALGNRTNTVHITRSKEGQFGAVIVGSSLDAKYPETSEIWSGRMTYTVYVGVGLPHSWILQYSLSRGGNAPQGNIAGLAAPYPFNIVRPNLAPGSIDADALMVHGYVNLAGRFENLAVVFPPDFPQAKFVLDSLAQWQFRPATLNNQDVRVEVLLIIPETEE
jgi:hypothetical protein